MTSREAVVTATERFNAHDLDGFAEVLADDVSFHAPGGVGGSGKKACVEFYSRWLSEFPDAHLEVRDRHIADGVAVEHGTLTGTHHAAPSIGRTIALDYVQVLRVRDGKQVSLRLMFDRLVMLEQLGLLADRS